jgi:hypothetical protein
MIKLKELIELKSLVYTEEVKPKHQEKIDMKLTVFHEELALPYRPKPDNDSPTTMRELKYLSKLETDKAEVKRGDDIRENFLPLIEDNDIPLSKEYVNKVIKESGKFIMKLKYHYNRPRPYQVAEVYELNLNGTELDSMKTPSYPSGHAVQAYLLGELFSNVDPRGSHQYRELAERVAHSRVIAKGHYPSDKSYGKKVAKVLFQGVIKK